MNKYHKAARNQGFDLSVSDSPVPVPEGWHDGSVHQTGGYIMVRIWRTWDGHTGVHSGRDVEFEVAYGENPGITLRKYVWDERIEAYETIEPVKERAVSDNSDITKARVAQELMEEFDREEHTELCSSEFNRRSQVWIENHLGEPFASYHDELREGMNGIASYATAREEDISPTVDNVPKAAREFCRGALVEPNSDRLLQHSDD